MSDATTVASDLLATGVVPPAARRHLQGVCGQEVPLGLAALDTQQAVERILSLNAAAAVASLHSLDAEALVELARHESRVTVHRAMVDANLKSVTPQVQGQVLVELAVRGHKVEDLYRQFDYADVAAQVHQRPQAAQLLWNRSVLEKFLDRLFDSDPSGRMLAGWLDDHAEHLDGDTNRPLVAYVAERVFKRLAVGEHRQVPGEVVTGLIGPHTDPVTGAVAVAAARLLVHEADVDTDTRLAIVLSSRQLAHRWLAGQTVNDPRPGEIVQALELAGGWRKGGHPFVAELASMTSPNRRHRPAWMPEIVGTLPAAKAFATVHVTAAAQRIRDLIGDTPDAWQTLCSLVAGFDGSLDDLCEVALTLAEPST